MTTGATLFSGGELAGTGMRQAGVDHKWGIELDDDIANVARANGFHVLTADILDIDPVTMEPIDALHASPPCTRASNANQGAELNDDGTKEAPLDIALAEKVAEFIDVLQPRIFTLENVYAYRNFKAFGIITAALDRGGYFWSYEHVNAADYGVPQTRRRLILRAVRGALLPPLPAPEPWIGWYKAIADLIPTLPDSKFAKWQLERLPTEITGTFFANLSTPRNSGITVSGIDEPVPTITATTYRRPVNVPKAFILSNAKTEYGDGIRDGQEPAGTVTGESNGRVRAWLVAQGGYDGNVVNRPESEPSFTVTANNNQNNGVRAWLVNSENQSRELTIKQDDSPAFSVAYGGGTYPRAWLSQGRVVKLTPRALARFQSVPDDYKLPTNRKQLESFAAFLLGIPESLAHFVIERETTDNGLACKVIGNGVPCLLMEKIYKQLIQGA